jgi:hypothetical protein
VVPCALAAAGLTLDAADCGALDTICRNVASQSACGKVACCSFLLSLSLSSVLLSLVTRARPVCVRRRGDDRAADVI